MDVDSKLKLPRIYVTKSLPQGFSGFEGNFMEYLIVYYPLTIVISGDTVSLVNEN